MSDITIFTDIGELATLQKAAAKNGRKCVDDDLSIIKNAAMVVAEGRIKWVGAKKDLKPLAAAKEISLKNRAVIPGLVDCHTHLVFAGSRADEFELRLRGMSYQDIAKQGGGIVSTVAATRAASFDNLHERAQQRANNCLRQGVTTIEIKSGYGLNLDDEFKILEVAGSLQTIRVVRTFLGPHALPKEFKKIGDYVEFIVKNVLPQVAKRKLASRADIFIEKGYFTIAHAEKYFSAAFKLGLDLVAHAEQLSRLGSTALLKKFDIVSFDHLVYLQPADITRLAKSTSMSVLLPASDFYLQIPFPKARKLIDAGARVALATDFNPGSSPTQDIHFVGLLGRLEMKMSRAEVLTALTVGGASALRKENDVGSLEIGKFADFCVLDSDLNELFYQVGRNPVAQTWVEGALFKQ